MPDLEPIARQYRTRFPSDAAFFDTVMMEIQSHMVQIEDMRRERDEHMHEEIADLAAYALILAHAHDIDGDKLAARAKKL